MSDDKPLSLFGSGVTVARNKRQSNPSKSPRRLSRRSSHRDEEDAIVIARLQKQTSKFTLRLIRVPLLTAFFCR